MPRSGRAEAPSFPLCQFPRYSLSHRRAIPDERVTASLSVMDSQEFPSPKEIRNGFLDSQVVPPAAFRHDSATEPLIDSTAGRVAGTARCSDLPGADELRRVAELLGRGHGGLQRRWPLRSG